MKPYDEYLLGLEKEEMVAELIQWVNINSSTDNIVGLAKMLARLKAAFSPLNCTMKEIPLPPYQTLDDHGNLKEHPLGNALFMQKRPEAPIQVFLGGHMDTVYPAHSPFQKAERVGDDVLNGPGVTDMKGGLMILLKTLETLEKTPFAKKIGWRVLINSDEEIGSPGSAGILKEMAKECTLGLIFEPALPNGSIVNERKGSLNFSVVSKGKSAHAGRDFHSGKNAISSLCRFIIEIEKLTNIETGVTVNVGKIHGGGPINIVPDLASCGVNIRMASAEDLPKIKEHLEKLVQEQGLILHINCERPPKPFESKHQPLFSALKVCGHDLGLKMHFQSSGGVTDGNLLFAAGLPCIDSLGAFGGEIHTHHEFLYIDSLVEKTKLASLFLMKLGKGTLWKQSS